MRSGENIVELLMSCQMIFSTDSPYNMKNNLAQQRGENDKICAMTNLFLSILICFVLNLTNDNSFRCSNRINALWE